MWITSMGNHGVAGGILECRRSSFSSFDRYIPVSAGQAVGLLMLLTLMVNQADGPVPFGTMPSAITMFLRMETKNHVPHQCYHGYKNIDIDLGSIW